MKTQKSPLLYKKRKGGEGGGGGEGGKRETQTDSGKRATKETHN